MSSVAFVTLGCKVNQFETEVMEGLFKEAGYEILPHEAKADIYVINLGDTRYGGTLDVGTGVLTVDWAIVDMGTLNWEMSATASSIGGAVFYTQISTIGMAKRYRNTPNTMLSSVFATAPTARWFIVDMPDNEVFSNETSVFVSASQYSDASAFKSAMSGVQLAYELANLITVQLTANEISTLLGQNNIWSDVGDVDVTYCADTKLYIDQKLATAIANTLNA